MRNIFSKKRILFLLLFTTMVLVGKKINFSALVGAENQFFTMFQFFGPIAGSFLGPIFGIISVLIAELLDFILIGKTFTLINIIRLTPMLFAAYYFGTKKKSISILIPLIAIFLFMIHPVGRQVWFFSLYWTIPIIVKLLPRKYSNNVLLKSLGATFTAHSVGSTAWIYTVPMTAQQWITLIPIVAFERLLFAAGIAGSYIIINTLLDKLVQKFKWKIPADILYIDKALILSKKLFRLNT
jgi:hypothetical protein